MTPNKRGNLHTHTHTPTRAHTLRIHVDYQPVVVNKKVNFSGALLESLHFLPTFWKQYILWKFTDQVIMKTKCDLESKKCVYFCHLCSWQQPGASAIENIWLELHFERPLRVMMASAVKSHTHTRTHSMSKKVTQQHLPYSPEAAYLKCAHLGWLEMRGRVTSRLTLSAYQLAWFSCRTTVAKSTSSSGDLTHVCAHLIVHFQEQSESKLLLGK